MFFSSGFLPYIIQSKPPSADMYDNYEMSMRHTHAWSFPSSALSIDAFLEKRKERDAVE
jgi:hypothetical protein